MYHIVFYTVLEINISKGRKYLLPGKILSSKLDLFDGKILTKDDPSLQPTSAKTNIFFDHEK